MDVNEVLKFANENKALITLTTPFIIQGLSWLVKKSPWLWDDDLFSWTIKNKAGIKQVVKAVKNRKKK